MWLRPSRSRRCAILRRRCRDVARQSTGPRSPNRGLRSPVHECISLPVDFAPVPDPQNQHDDRALLHLIDHRYDPTRIRRRPVNCPLSCVPICGCCLSSSMRHSSERRAPRRMWLRPSPSRSRRCAISRRRCRDVATSPRCGYWEQLGRKRSALLFFPNEPSPQAQAHFTRIQDSGSQTSSSQPEELLQSQRVVTAARQLDKIELKLLKQAAALFAPSGHQIHEAPANAWV